jgi:hypothetical protein
MALEEHNQPHSQVVDTDAPGRRLLAHREFGPNCHAVSLLADELAYHMTAAVHPAAVAIA